MISNSLCDNDDVQREIRCLFVRTNILLENVLSPSNYPCLEPTVCASIILVYGANIQSLCLNVLKHVNYNKWIKSFFLNYRTLDSVTDLLSELGLPTIRTVFNECVHKFKQRWLTSVNGVVRHFIRSCTFSL